MQRIVGIILPFIVRTVLIYSLSASYAGLSGLFASVLSVLNLAELGISNAIVYSMYKPVSEGDESKVCALLNVYRKAYRIIGLVIVSLGLFLVPFLQYLIHGSVPDDVNIYLLFGIYLSNTVVATGCNRTQDRHSRENRPLKKGIQTGGK
jgi:O-antigen/teichoic acid export membrane protein